MCMAQACLHAVNPRVNSSGSCSICLHLPVHRAGHDQHNCSADICLCKLCFLQTHVEVVDVICISQTAAVDQRRMTPALNAPDRSTHCCLQSLLDTTCRWGTCQRANSLCQSSSTRNQVDPAVVVITGASSRTIRYSGM
jgi:hypothetical protein